jgi:2-dehydropantoate 2-reductase
LKIAIIGIGGVGGYFGAKLAHKYVPTREHSIFFLARGKHLAEIKKNGLKVLTQEEGDFRAKPTVATNTAKDLGKLDLVFFCVKTYHLENAAIQLVDNIHEKTVVISLLNGVDNVQRLRNILAKGSILNGFVYIGSFIQAPGVIKQVGGSRQLFFGPENGDIEKYRYIEDLLTNVGIKAELTADITTQVWTKYIFISSLATITSLQQKTFGEILEDGKNKQMLEGLMKEVELIAKKRGVTLSEDIVSLSLEKISALMTEHLQCRGISKVEEKQNLRLLPVTL